MNTVNAVRPRRFAIKRRGEITWLGRSELCLIYNISLTGMFIICNYDWLAQGTMVEVSFELEPGSKFACKLEIRYADDGCCGGLIVDADTHSKIRLEKFIATHFSHQEHLPERRMAR
jgi:hypothetical protein